MYVDHLSIFFRRCSEDAALHSNSILKWLILVSFQTEMVKLVHYVYIKEENKCLRISTNSDFAYILYEYYLDTHTYG
jgi:hypothetical protein